ncbi:PRC-barrel domain-containing protein [Pseudaminobacter soli (ex Li et al. 2025)]|uniref:Photosystem reaction center subunit H n=1 Tax=Pseudaminobacter soli (ex Li et al. 2025) TaxID=1295366 RepID=A0A2P7S186_9HYPH|nr:PRC-barrel domain-containing protein [Mesorhizobium soli]PSJ56220.1 photosystem reaction center subunit H [Mesorhizobium soli]
MNDGIYSYLVDSDDVIGTNVYDSEGEHIGKVERLVLRKIDGRVAHAVLTFGGVWGLGADYYPIPWSELQYNDDLDGFQIQLTQDQIENGPKYDPKVDYDWSSENDRRINEYYGVADR